KKINFWAVAAVLAAASLAYSFYELAKDPSAAFYLPFSRLWELLTGALLACYFLKRSSPKGVIGRNVSSVLGATLIAVGVIAIAKSSPFPGWRALLPTTGAALIILAGQRAWLNRRVLSWRPVVWFGLISYPLYLWHWPLLVIPRIVLGQTPPDWIRLLAVALAIVLAS